MENRKKIILGILFVVILFIVGWGINYLRGRNLFNRQTSYYIKYNRVNGLMVSNPVTVKGYRIGKVSDIAFSSVKDPDMIVKIDIKKDLFIPENTVAVIQNQDIMGSKEISLRLGNAETYLNENDTLISKIELGLKDALNEKITPVKEKAESVMQKLDTIFTMFNRIFDKKTQNGISNSLENIEETFVNINKSSSNLNEIIYNEKGKLSSIFTNIDSITYNLNAQQGEINRAIKNIRLISDDINKLELDQAVAKFNETINNLNIITEKINSGNGSAALLINNDSLYRNLEDASRNLNVLLKDINSNPKRYVHFSIFGRKN